MIFKGDKFRILKIYTKNLSGKLYQLSHNHKVIEYNFEQVLKLHNASHKQSTEIIYACIIKRNSKNSPLIIDHCKDDELLEALKNPIFVKENLADAFHILYHVDKRVFTKGTIYNFLGKIMPEHIESELYQYTSLPLRVQYATKSGMMNSSVPKLIAPGDLLLELREDSMISCYKIGLKQYEFAGYQCDVVGEILNNNPCYPGDFMISLTGDGQC